jgi:hypothetical protein
VGVPEVGHVRPLRDVEPDEEPVAIRPQIGLEFTKPLDSDCI